jgi:3-oxoacyl-[acyl-carrier protein] reductase
MTTRTAALVTGGSTGIGATLCSRLIAAGYHVVSLSRRPAEQQSHLDSIIVDLTDPAATAQAAAEIGTRYEISRFIHNAGAIRANPIEMANAADIATLSQLHLGAALTLCQAVLPSMTTKSDGRIVLVSSRAAMGLATRTAYAATKSGMIGMARTWALELAPRGITVNVVAPGPIESTEMFHEVLPKGDARISALAQSIPVKRLGKPEDVANAVMFFASPEASFVTGQVLYVCGGTSIGALTI